MGYEHGALLPNSNPNVAQFSLVYAIMKFSWAQIRCQFQHFEIGCEIHESIAHSIYLITI